LTPLFGSKCYDLSFNVIKGREEFQGLFGNLAFIGDMQIKEFP
jgi:hypothetical protein